jgi:hypothetical protein
MVDRLNTITLHVPNSCFRIRGHFRKKFMHTPCTAALVQRFVDRIKYNFSGKLPPPCCVFLKIFHAQRRVRGRMLSMSAILPHASSSLLYTTASQADFMTVAAVRPALSGAVMQPLRVCSITRPHGSDKQLHISSGASGMNNACCATSSSTPGEKSYERHSV